MQTSAVRFQKSIFSESPKSYWINEFSLLFEKCNYYISDRVNIARKMKMNSDCFIKFSHGTALCWTRLRMYLIFIPTDHPNLSPFNPVPGYLGQANGAHLLRHLNLWSSFHWTKTVIRFSCIFCSDSSTVMWSSADVAFFRSISYCSSGMDRVCYTTVFDVIVPFEFSSLLVLLPS